MSQTPSTMGISTKVDFYLLDSFDRTSLLHFACRLTNKAYVLGKRIGLRAGSAAEATVLDDLLWTFNDASFIPHRCLDSEAVNDSTADPREILISQNLSPTAAEVLINLASTLPEEPTGFLRIAEIVGADAQQRANAREHFKHYRHYGMALDTHFINNAN